MRYETTSLQTKRLLGDTLKQLMQTKPFSKITVSELVRECGINRKTFYYHFEDIYALLHWVLEGDALEVLRNFDLLEDYESAIRYSMDYVKRSGHIINCSYDSIGRDGLKRFFYEDFFHLVLSVVNRAERSLGGNIPPAFKEYAAKFYAEALAAMLLDWVQNGKASEQEQTVQYLTHIISEGISSMLRNIQKA